MRDGKENNLLIVAEIIDYHPDDLHFDYDDGSFEWFDSSELKIITPSHLKGKKLYLHHNEPAKKNSFWFEKGTIIEFELKRNYSDLSESIFKDLIFIDGININKQFFP